MKATKSPSLKEATDAIVSMDFDKVIEYKIKFVRDDKEGNWWEVSRKILTNFPMGTAKWVKL